VLASVNLFVPMTTLREGSLGSTQMAMSSAASVEADDRCGTGSVSTVAATRETVRSTCASPHSAGVASSQTSYVTASVPVKPGVTDLSGLRAACRDHRDAVLWRARDRTERHRAA
jgi:hypothetical protein